MHIEPGTRGQGYAWVGCRGSKAKNVGDTACGDGSFSSESPEVSRCHTPVVKKTKNSSCVCWTVCLMLVTGLTNLPITATNYTVIRYKYFFFFTKLAVTRAILNCMGMVEAHVGIHPLEDTANRTPWPPSGMSVKMSACVLSGKKQGATVRFGEVEMKD